MGAPSTSTVTLRVSKRTKAFIEKRTAVENFASYGAYIDSLVREKQYREKKARLDQLLKEGLFSGKAPVRADDAYWAEIESRYLKMTGRSATGKSSKSRRTKKT